jgi:hypothetical protein
MAIEPFSIAETANALPGLWDAAVRIRGDWINRNRFLYALDFEARLNLDLLDALNDAALISGAAGSAASPAFAELADSFETGATRALVAGNDRRQCKKLANLLKKHWKPASALDPEDEKNTPLTIEGVLDNFSFAAQKIETLRRLSRIAGKEAPFLREINLKTRLKNLKTALLNIRRCLAAVITEIEQRQ